MVSIKQVHNPTADYLRGAIAPVASVIAIWVEEHDLHCHFWLDYFGSRLRYFNPKVGEQVLSNPFIRLILLAALGCCFFIHCRFLNSQPPV